MYEELGAVKILHEITISCFIITTVTEEIRRYSSQYSARLSAHPNGQ
jgi:hypothetical protein